MIYVETSALLAHLLAEDRRPPASQWRQSLVSSRLLECEVWTRLHALGRAAESGEAARRVMARINRFEISRPVFDRVIEPLPRPLRTPAALHLATALVLRSLGQDLQLATYDRRLAEVAELLGIRAIAI